MAFAMSLTGKKTRTTNPVVERYEAQKEMYQSMGAAQRACKALVHTLKEK